MLEAVLPWAESRFGADTHREGRILAGASNGAAWALVAAQRSPRVFGGAIGFSVAGWSPQQLTERGRNVRLGRNVRCHLAAGTLEPFMVVTRAWVDALAAAGAAVTFRERVAGHDFCSWVEQLPGAIASVLDSTRT